MTIYRQYYCDTCYETSEYELELCPYCKRGHVYQDGEALYCCNECVECQKCKHVVNTGGLVNCPQCGSKL